MRRNLSIFRSLKSLICVIFFGLLGFYFSANFSGDKMAIHSEKIGIIFEKTKVVCFGRFIMNVPVNVDVVYGKAAIDGNVGFHKGKAKEIPDILTARISEIERERSKLPDYSLSGFPLAGSVMEGVVPGQKTVFGIRDSVSYRIHSYIPVGKDLFIYDTNAFPEKDEIPFINNIANKLRHRDELEVPSEPGICVESGFLPVDPTFESISIGLRFRDFPDVHISIDMRKNQDYLMGEGGLKESRESAKTSAEAIGLGGFFSRIKVLRESKRQLGVWKGEEILTRRPSYKNETDAHEFRFFSLGAVNDAAHPMFDIQLDSGVKGNLKAKVEPSVTDEEAIALWDRILPTIRLRQASDATPPIFPAPTVLLGTLRKSGDICPQSGWWECMEKRKIDGKRRRLFKEGEELPPVVADGRTGLWRTLIGDTYQIAKVEWKLIEHQQALVSALGEKARGMSDEGSATKDSDA